MDGSGVPVIGVSPAAACPTSASQFPDNRENNRESAKFPVNSALAGVNSSSNFKRLQGIPRCLRKRRILKQFQRLAGDFPAVRGTDNFFVRTGNWEFRAGVHPKSETRKGCTQSPAPWDSAAVFAQRRLHSFFRGSSFCQNCTDPQRPVGYPRAGARIWSGRRFRGLIVSASCIRSHALRHVTQDDRNSCGRGATREVLVVPRVAARSRRVLPVKIKF